MTIGKIKITNSTKQFIFNYIRMGARVSVSFKNQTEESVILFDHWGGEALIQYAEEFREYMVDYAKKQARKSGSNPLTRLEVGHAMVRFVVWLVDRNLYSDSMYFGKDIDGGDNSDYGHYTVDFTSYTQV